MNGAILFILLVSLFGCANNKSLVIAEPYLNWAPFCYKGFDERVQELANGPYLNCGFFSSAGKQYRSDGFFHNLSNGLTCIDDAIKHNKSFVFGTHFFWKDTYLCEAFVYSNEGELYRLFFDFDTAGLGDTSGDRSLYNEEVCEKLEITEKIIVPHYINYVSASGCERYIEK